MSSRGFTILVADADDDARGALAKRLVDEGYKVRQAASSEPALAAAVGGSVHLALLSLELPGMGGLDVLRQIRALRSSRELPVVMTTDDPGSPGLVEALREGANDFVARDLDLAVVLARVMAHLKSCFPGKKAGAEEVSLYDEVEEGSTVDGRYRLTSLIGEGQHGAVWRGTHMQLDRPVAVKLLRTGVADDDLVERFIREGISACRVDHPNAVKVLDAGVTGREVPYLVLELLNGHNLGEELAGGRKLDVGRCAEILIPVCHVLHQTHAAGVIHRDIKPQNVFLHETRQGEVVKVLDFGIAKLLDEGDHPLTLDGSGPGTPAYMAPERLAGQEYDGRADVYSLGVMLYEMLSGRQPFNAGGNPIRLAMMHLQAAPEPLGEVLPEVDPQLEHVVMKTLEKDPEHRPTTSAFAHLFAAAAGFKAVGFPDVDPLDPV